VHNHRQFVALFFRDDLDPIDPFGIDVSVIGVWLA
jgi:hypothetical protein